MSTKVCPRPLPATDLSAFLGVAGGQVRPRSRAEIPHGQTPAVGAAAFSGRTKYSSSSASDRRRTGFRSLTPGFDWSEPSRFHGILQAQLQEIVASGDGTFRRKRWRGSPVDSNRPRRSPEGSAPRVGIAYTARLYSRS